MKPNGIIVYEGKSQLDGKPIVCIITGTAKKSSNTKTGENILQSWIIRSDINPFSAWCTGADKSVCGNCIHRHGTCYVNKAQAVYQVYKAYKNGKYPKLDCYNVDLIKGKALRLGSYGEFAAIPQDIAERIISYADKYTGYTHQFEKFNWLKKYCMASVETTEKQAKAAKLGFRTFRVRMENEPVLNTEFKCPASEESGKKTNCDKCLACSGLSSKIKKNVTIIIHGAAKKRYVKIMTLKKRHKKISHLFMKKY